MKYKLKAGEGITLMVQARDYYSEQCIEVLEGELYQFFCDPAKKWKDWFVKSDADGFKNWFLFNRYKRVPGVKFFVLCGTIGNDENDHFPIGTELSWQAPKNGMLYFFANDHKNRKFYRNNKGGISLNIHKIR